MISEKEKQICLNVARESIAEKLKIVEKMSICPSEAIFKRSFGLFVTLNIKARLRGCIGYIIPYKPLYESLVELSRAAAFNDNRFKPVVKEEFDDLHIEISILSPLFEVKDKKEIVVGRDGLYMQHPRGSGLLLPQVATKYGWNRAEFLKETCHKAGLQEDFLDDKVLKIFRFEAEIFS